MSGLEPSKGGLVGAAKEQCCGSHGSVGHCGFFFRSHFFLVFFIKDVLYNSAFIKDVEISLFIFVLLTTQETPFLKNVRTVSLVI